MSEKLKPCPFCGGEADIRGNNTEGFYIGCDSALYLPCYCNLFYRGDELPRFYSREEAIEAWNRRAEKRVKC